MSGLKVDFNKRKPLGSAGQPFAYRGFVVQGVGGPLWDGARVFESGGRSGSSWWREIVRIRDGVDSIGGGWFGECVLKKVGDGLETFFWTDTWLDVTPLSVRYQHLFDLTVHKSSTVADMFSLGWGVGGGDVGGVSGSTSQFLLQVQSPDLW
ncbi:cysteine-rich receptor-like protein kinase [Trifolium medium]|uniref:Cysteine-rich receptor-like protein kinase n=1 Tax=Trifolium medium TaxID=97028 RepID=A0A392NQ63_9FABA|nr:cysteine-rich receptor-like protein kinase [Trifolium medium]